MGTQLGKEDLLRWQAAVEAHGQGDAEVAYNNLCEMEEQPAPIVFNLAMMHCSAGNFSIAHTMLTEAITKNKHLVVARFQRALVSHRLEKNEDAMLDLQACIEMMHEADFINYNTLGLEYVFCRHYAQHNLAVIRLVLGLREMSAEMQLKARATQERLRANLTIMDLAKDNVEVPLIELTDFVADPCKMNHEHGECPMLRLPAMLVFKPAGLGKDILKTTVGERRDFLGRKQAKVLFTKDKSDTAFGPGFRGRQHVEEFMPMAITTAKQRKQKKKKPGAALAGLIKGATPRIMMVKPTAHPSGGNSRSASLPTIEQDTLADKRLRSKSLFIPTKEEHEEEETSPAEAVAKDDIKVGTTRSESPETAHDWDKDGRKAEIDSKSFLGIKKTSIGLAKSIEVLYGGDGTTTVATAVTPSDSDTASSSHDDDGGYDSRMHINVTTQMTPTTLRDLADLLEHLQQTDKEQKFIVNVHMHQRPAPGV